MDFITEWKAMLFCSTVWKAKQDMLNKNCHGEVTLLQVLYHYFSYIKPKAYNMN